VKKIVYLATPCQGQVVHMVSMIASEAFTSLRKAQSRHEVKGEKCVALSFRILLVAQTTVRDRRPSADSTAW